MSTIPSVATGPDSAVPGAGRLARIQNDLCRIFDEVCGVDLTEEAPTTAFLDLGLDSLALTQVALQLQNAFAIKVTFRQLIETYSSLQRLAEHLDKTLPAPPASAAPAPAPPAPEPTPRVMAAGLVQIPSTPPAARGPAPGSSIQAVVDQQLAIMAQQLVLLSGAGGRTPAGFTAPASVSVPAAPPLVAVVAATGGSKPAVPGDDEAPSGMVTYDAKKAFGAIARIHARGEEISPAQKARVEAFVRRYVARTPKSKAYTSQHRPHLADPRVVNGFRPLTKEIVYQIVVDRSKGARVWDLDGNEYVDVLSGFGMSLFGWQPPFVIEAIKKQLDLGYEIGPQHVLAGEVARLICELTGFERAGLCNTGSEAVMGAMRIARTVTGRSTIAIFTGSYHGIFDEVIVRGTKKLRALPAAPGILPSSAQNVLVLDYGTPESLEIIRARAGELAAVLVEPVQSRRPDFQPREFLAELRQITERSGTVYIWDEVVTGFRAHPAGTQGLFGIKADLASYGKVIGGGFPIGVIAGKRQYMDALDGGSWQYGDDSAPTVGVTYFAGTFVRHPLALAACKASLEHLKAVGPALQEELTSRTSRMAAELNAFSEAVGAPVRIRHFASLWRTSFTEEHPLQDLLFAMLRIRGVHVLDNFPCFLTTAHTDADVAFVVKAFKDALTEMMDSGFFGSSKPAPKDPPQYDATRPPVPGARLGRDPDGTPAWFVPNPAQPGKYMRLL